MIITDPESTTIEMVSTILYGDPRAHRDGQVKNLSSVWAGQSSSTDHFAANTDFIHVGDPNDPNDTRDWSDMKELAQHERSTPDDLKLAGGHVFGENTGVPLSAIVTHRDGQAVLGALNNASSWIPVGADVADMTDLAEPFEIPRIGINRPPEEETAFEDSEEDEHDVARPSKRRHTQVVDDDAASSQTSDDENDYENDHHHADTEAFWSSGDDGSDDNEHEVARPSKRRNTRLVDEDATSSQTSHDDHHDTASFWDSADDDSN